MFAGAFASETKAARAHDLISIKMRGDSAKTNFPVYTL